MNFDNFLKSNSGQFLIKLVKINSTEIIISFLQVLQYTQLNTTLFDLLR